MLAPQDSEDRTGPPSCIIIPKTPGRVMRLQVTDRFFRSLFAFFIIDIHTRQVIHVGLARSPTDAWTARTAPRGNPPLDDRQSILFVIVMTSSDPLSHAWLQPAA